MALMQTKVNVCEALPVHRKISQNIKRNTLAALDSDFSSKSSYLVFKQLGPGG